ncbi:sensor histidine kinase [Embleya scabrispora]|uniref:sensor histidine kinase n=1 Tax=Embleya scabrispora TaxID=159449 RepID=UPI00036E3056|nr:sensor histidine kinase [Embleya scabrispora]
MHTDAPGPPPAEVLDPLWSHPLVIRAARLGRRLRRADRAHPWALDAAIVMAVCLMFCVPDLIHRNGPRELTGVFHSVPVAATVALQAGLVLPLLWRRRAPFPAFAAITAVFVLQWSIGVWLRTDVALLIALYSLALHGRLRRLPWAGLLLAAVPAVVAARLWAVVSVGEGLFFLFCAITAATALGFAVRIRRAQLAVLREHAARMEIERDQRSKLAAAGERTRVAREMHDIVGHNLSVMITLADGGAYAARVTPERGPEALDLIADTGRQALGELRRMLGALREQTDALELSPQPGMADLDALCSRIRAAGPQVEYRSTGDVAALDRGVQLAAYRIAQEALTNALKHAGPQTRARLALNVRKSRLRIHVQDTGPPTDDKRPTFAPEEGHGLAGMRERAALYGGTVVAGPRPGGGWTVQATLHLAPLPGPQGAAS